MAEGGNRPARRAGLLPPLSWLSFFEGGFRQAKCVLVAQTQGYPLVCIWGNYIKFQGGGVVSKAMLYARLHFEGFLFRDLSPLVQSLVSPSNAGGFVSSWMSCCCTDTGLSCGVHLG